MIFDSSTVGLVVWELFWGFFVALSWYAVYWAANELDAKYQERSIKGYHIVVYIITVILGLLAALASFYMMFFPLKGG